MPNAYIFDDDHAAADSLAARLDRLGYEARVVLGPLPALEALAPPGPDVIFLDLDSQGAGSVDVCERLRRDPRTARVPIVVLASSSQPEMLERLQLAGASAFLPKPVDPDALAAVLRRLEALRARFR